jgi:hypothetical protein
MTTMGSPTSRLSLLLLSLGRLMDMDVEGEEVGLTAVIVIVRTMNSIIEGRPIHEVSPWC